MGFLKRWEPKQESNGHQNTAPLRPRLEEALMIINQQAKRLELISSHLKEKDGRVFERVVYCYRNRDPSRARMYAMELGEIRKLSKTIMATRIAFEQIAMRISTVKEYGDLAISIEPALLAVKSISGGIAQMIPEADQSMSKLGDILNGLMVDASQYDRGEITTYANEESERILKEASNTAKSMLTRSLPEIPNGMSKTQVQQNISIENVEKRPRKVTGSGDKDSLKEKVG